MSWILIANPKGGCGKTTLAVQLASLLAESARVVGLYDADPQASSLDWARRRDPRAAPVNAQAVAGPSDIRREDDDYCIIDTASAQSPQSWLDALRPGDVWLIPVQASPVDLAALASLPAQVLPSGVMAGVVASRVNPQTLNWRLLQRAVAELPWPLFGWLRDTQQYLHAMQEGMGLFDAPGHASLRDRMQWHSLLEAIFPDQPALSQLPYQSAD